MVAAGEDELVCDLAQTYHVFDWRELPLMLAATLAAGLPDDSRCKRRAASSPAAMNTVLLATIADQLSLMLWRYAEKGTPRPASILAALSGKLPAKANIRRFRSGADFDRELQKFIT